MTLDQVMYPEMACDVMYRDLTQYRWGLAMQTIMADPLLENAGTRARRAAQDYVLRRLIERALRHVRAQLLAGRILRPLTLDVVAELCLATHPTVRLLGARLMEQLPVQGEEAE